jgi:putative CocE/NonD family hydrolase
MKKIIHIFLVHLMFFSPLAYSQVAKEYMVKGEDELKFYTATILPDENKKYPVIVYRTPYAKKNETLESIKGWYKRLTDGGYAVVYQHTRGSGKSEGERYPYDDERKDGLALLDWIRAQPFYNGEIYLDGGSYCSSVHISYLETNQPDIKGAILRVMDVERYNVLYHKGFFKMLLHGSWYLEEYRKKAPIQRDLKLNRFKVFPLTDLTKKVFGFSVKEYDTPLLHPERTDPFWDTKAGGSEYRNAVTKSKIPLLLISSFYDIFIGGIFDMWRSIPEWNRKNCAFVVTPYMHNVNKGIVKFPNGALSEAYPNFVVNWFNHIRKNEKLNFVELGKVKWYCLWQNQWHSADHLVNAPNSMKFYLNKNRTLDASPEEPTEITYAYDPQNPAKFAGGITFGSGGMRLQAPANSRPDVISFTSKPFEKDTIVEGRMKVSLTVKTDCEDTCFYIRAHIVKKDGKTYSLRDDITSVLREVKNYQPNTKVTINFELVEHSFMFEKGDKLRVDVSSSCIPSFSVHTNYKGNQNTIGKTKVANNTIISGESFIEIFTK